MPNRKPWDRDIIINDVSESKRHEPAIMEFSRAYSSGMIVNASEIRSKIFSYLGGRPKYDLILTGDRGGTLLFTDRQLLRFGKRIRRIPYSMHAGGGESGWTMAVKKEAELLGAKPRVLILESDVGHIGHTADKLAAAKRRIMYIREGAQVEIAAGAANRAAEAERHIDYVAYHTFGKVIRLSELVGGRKTWRKLQKTQEKLLDTMRYRGLRTGTLPH